MNEKKPANPWTKSLLIWVGVLFGLVLFVQMTAAPGAAASQAIPYSEFVRQVDEGSVKSVTTAANNTGNQVITGKLASGESFRTLAPADAQVTDRLIQRGVQVQAKEAEQSSFWLILLYQSLPFILILAISFFVMRQMQKGAGSGAMGFGKSRARMLTEKQGRVTFQDVAGIDEAREELQEIVEYLKDPGKFARLGGKIPKGALLVGPPGTGKTLLARAIAGEAGVPFFTISGSDFVEMFVGVGASRVRDMFDQAKKSAPCIVFIDEIDAVGRHRGAGLGNGNDEREQTLNQLLVEMDGFEANEGIIIIAATNRPDVLDPALLRPGRFDRQIVVPNPDVVGRERILRVHVPATDPVHKATIIPRGRALGMVMQLPERDKLSMSFEQMTSRLAIMMGGRIAEDMTFGPEKVTSGAQSDIDQATRLARLMVTRWGFSPELGTVAYGENQEEVFLGMSMGRTQAVSEATAQKIDSEVRRLVENGLKEARRILVEKREDLEVLAKGLLEYETLSGDEIRDLLNGKPPVRDTGDTPPPARPSPVPAAGRSRPRETDGGLEPQPQA